MSRRHSNEYRGGGIIERVARKPRSILHFTRPRRTRWLLPWLLLPTLGSQAARAGDLLSGLTPGGNLVLTSDYIYRGVSSSDNEAAVQADLHLTGAGGTFLGVWASTRDSNLEPYANYELEIYLGHRFDLSNAWSTTLSARGHYLLGGQQEGSDDYHEISLAVSYLDFWTVSLTAIPNAVRYWYTERLSRAPAFVADTSVQWLVYRGFFLTGGAGYYRVTGTGPGFYAANGYAYGNVGLAWVHRRWRVDIGYYLTQEKVQSLVPYPSADDRIAGSIAWRF
jgi:uncharacterized protein (TIGR02001 family)